MSGVKEFESLLEEEGYDLISMGVNGKALRQATALRAVEILEKNKIPILGGDILVIKNNTIDYTYDNWDCDEEDFSEYEDYLQKSWAISRKYIHLFEDKDDAIYLYQIVI
ncbi:MAG: hypothetical protein KAW12_28000 [Candidatus Aminicenantes bacterium]|nr:hypothetical protein [Candidatus Aminicenantes bacterium]